jgi:hypothetical protein
MAFKRGGGLKHPSSGSAGKLPHLAKVAKASKGGMVETPMTKLGKGSYGKKG